MKQDKLREGFCRVFGYAGAIAEVVQPLAYSRVIWDGYSIARLYVAADVIYTSTKSYKRENAIRSIITAGDTFIWQLFASLIIPGFVGSRVTSLSRRLLFELGVRKPLLTVSPSIIGLCSLAMIVEPLDDFMDFFMDETYRYAGAIGEAVRPVVPGRFANAAHSISTVYVFGDTIYWGATKYEKTDKLTQGLIAGGDSLIWNLFASIIIPTFATSRVTMLAGRFMPYHTFVPTAVGILICPLMVKPVDNFMDWFMDNTYRKLFD